MTWWQSPRLGPPTSALASIDFSRNSGIIFPATFRTSRVEPRKPCSRCSKIQRNNCIFFDARKPVLPELKLRAFPLRICTLCGNCRRKWCCSCNRCIDGDTCHNDFVSIAVSVAPVVAAVSVATVMLAETDVSRWTDVSLLWANGYTHTWADCPPPIISQKLCQWFLIFGGSYVAHCFCGHDTSSSPIFYAEAPIQGRG